MRDAEPCLDEAATPIGLRSRTAPGEPHELKFQAIIGVAVLIAAACFAVPALADLPAVPPVVAPSSVFKIKDGIDAMAFAPDGKKLATAKSWNKLHIWDLATPASQVESDVNVSANAIFWTPDGSKLVAVISEGGVLIVDAATGVTHPLVGAEKMKSAAMNRAGTVLVTGADGGAIAIWDLKAEKQTGTLTGTGKISAMALGDDGETLVVQADSADYTKSTTDIWNIKAKKILQSAIGRYGGSKGKPICILPNGGPIFFWQNSSLMRCENPTAAATEVCVMQSEIGMTAFSADGKLTAAQETHRFDGKIYLFETATGRLLATLSGAQNSSWAFAMVVSPDGKQVAALSPEGAALWKVPAADAPPAAVISAAARLDDTWEGFIEVDRDKVTRLLKSQGLTGDRLAAAVKDKVSYTSTPRPIYDFKPDGTGTITEVLYDKPTATSIRWTVKEDHGSEVVLHVIDKPAEGEKGREPYDMKIQFFSNDSVCVQMDELNPTLFNSTVWLHRTPRHYVAEFIASLTKARQAMTDESRMLETVKDVPTATAAALKIPELARAVDDGQLAAGNIQSMTTFSPSLSLAEESQAMDFNNRRSTLSADVLEIRLHPDWEKPMHEALSNIRVELGAQQVPPQITAAELIGDFQKDAKAAGTKYQWKTMLVEGKVRRVVINGGPNHFENFVEIVGNDQPDDHPACIQCLSSGQNLNDLKPGMLVRVAGDVGSSIEPPAVSSMGSCFYIRPNAKS